MQKRPCLPKIGISNNTLCGLEPVFVANHYSNVESRVFHQIVYFNIFPAKQNILNKNPYSCKTGHISQKQAFLTTRQVILTPLFVPDHYSNAVVRLIFCILAYSKQNKNISNKNPYSCKNGHYLPKIGIFNNTLCCFEPVFCSKSLF